MEPTRKGKIARLPAALREAINQRLLDGEPASRILPWLNDLPEVRKMLEGDFEGLRVNDQNLSDWRQGGYQDWLRRRERLADTREMAAFSIKLAKANGGNLTEGAASILAGQILNILESLPGLVALEAGGTPEETRARLEIVTGGIEELTAAVAKLRKGDHSAATLQLNRDRLAVSVDQLKLEKEKFLTLICGKLLELAKDARFAEIAASGRTNAEKIAALRQTYFADIDALEKSGGGLPIPE